MTEASRFRNKEERRSCLLTIILTLAIAVPLAIFFNFFK
nr:MAG TPA: type VI secretion protein [Caudoviricetes sp.]